jgi:hypothetical protein
MEIRNVAHQFFGKIFKIKYRHTLRLPVVLPRSKRVELFAGDNKKWFAVGKELFTLMGT